MPRAVIGTYRLKYPSIRETIYAGDVKEEELKPAGFEVVVSRPRARDLKILDKHEGEEAKGSMALIAAVSNLDEDDVEFLDFEDMTNLGNLLGAVFSTGPKIGASA